MRIAVFATKAYDRRFLDLANAEFGHDLSWFEARLDETTAPLADGFDAVCVFVNDRLDAPALTRLAQGGVRAVALRCAGYNNVDLRAAEALGLTVIRVPAYSPEAVAEFTLGLLLAMNRNIPRASARVRENNFALDGLIGRNLSGRAAGVVGTGRIGALVARALKLGFGCEVLAHDVVEDPALTQIGVRYVDRETLLRQSDIISLHCPLTPDTRHLIDGPTLAAARPRVMIVNTSRGALIDTQALIDALKNHRVGGVALDVYEQEGDLFFEDLSDQIVEDDIFQRLLTFPNVLVTGHQAFFTEEAISTICETTINSVTQFANGQPLSDEIKAA